MRYAVVGSGPSKIGLDLTRLKGTRTITVNNAWETMPWAEHHFFADKDWRDRYGAKLLAGFKGRLWTAEPPRKHVPHPRMTLLRREYKLDLAQPGMLAGLDSGSMAVNLAYHLGASEIVLVGLDMQFSNGVQHDHEDHHGKPSIETHYTKRFAPKLSRMIGELTKRGITVTRATHPGVPEAAFDPSVLYL